MKFTGIDQIVIRTKNAEEMDRYYREVLDARKCREVVNADGEKEMFYEIGEHGQYIQLIEGDADEYVSDNRKCNRSHFHCCFEVDARHEAYRDMQKKGVPIGHTPEDTVGMCGSWCSFITDPEGNEWELMEFSPVSRQIEKDAHNLRFDGR